MDVFISLAICVLIFTLIVGVLLAAWFVHPLLGMIVTAIFVLILLCWR